MLAPFLFQWHCSSGTHLDTVSFQRGTVLFDMARRDRPTAGYPSTFARGSAAFRHGQDPQFTQHLATSLNGKQSVAIGTA
jgi:hypothetical protein